MTRLYAYVCDGPGCHVLVIGANVGGALRTAATAAEGAGVSSEHKGKHYCLEHYPYSLCEWCGARMRPHSSAAKDWPGTRAKGARGYCSTCTSQEKRFGKPLHKRQAGGVD